MKGQGNPRDKAECDSLHLIAFQIFGFSVGEYAVKTWRLWVSCGESYRYWYDKKGKIRELTGTAREDAVETKGGRASAGRKIVRSDREGSTIAPSSKTGLDVRSMPLSPKH